MRSEFLRFLLVGGFAALVNLVSRYVLSIWIVYEASVALAYLVGMATAYSLTRIKVFAPSGKSVRNEVSWFVLVNALALVQVWCISVVLARWVFPAWNFTFYPEEVAHMIGVAAPVISSYFGHKHLTFAAPKPRTRSQ